MKEPLPSSASVAFKQRRLICAAVIAEDRVSLARSGDIIGINADGIARRRTESEHEVACVFSWPVNVRTQNVPQLEQCCTCCLPSPLTRALCFSDVD